MGMGLAPAIGPRDAHTIVEADLLPSHGALFRSK